MAVLTKASKILTTGLIVAAISSGANTASAQEVGDIVDWLTDTLRRTVC